jgi:F420H(2)-dependent quinone reductase
MVRISSQQASATRPPTVPQFVNELVKFILLSPLHSLLSKNRMLLTFTGRKSGKLYTIPLSYVQEGETILCITGNTSWWRNLRGSVPVKVMLKGQERDGIAQAIFDDPAVIIQGLQKLLLAIPGDAKYHEVKLDFKGQPNVEDMAQAANSSILIRIQLTY